MRLLIVGAGGMLGHEVARAGERAGHELTSLTRSQLDITDARAVARALGESQPDAALNCAAWTDVDGAESRREQAFAVNGAGAGNLASACAKLGVALVHVSTDYVFSGEPPRDEHGAPLGYVESDATGPRSVYGQSKLAGEHLVLAASPAHAVVRTSWLFGAAGRNFVERMLELASEQDHVRVVVDQVGCPTWTGHLAPALIGVAERGLSGLIHQAGGGRASWSELAAETFRQAEVSCAVQPCNTETLARPAPRPKWSVLASERADVLPMPDWRDGLAGYLAARAGVLRR
jgi:dTDP-4-dehydrorhamnose reductase